MLHYVIAIAPEINLIEVNMTGRNTYRRAKKVVSRGGSSKGSETPSTPIDPDSTCDQSQEEHECSGTQQSLHHSTYEQGVPVRHRGRTTCIDIQNMLPSTRVHIEVNENNVRSNILEFVLLGSYLGVIARDPVLAPISFSDWRNKGMEPFKRKMLAEVEERAAINAANAKKQTYPHPMGRVSSVHRQQEMAIKDRLLLWRINRLCKDGTWSSEDAKHRWIQACEPLAEDGLTPEDGNVDANERVFSKVMGPEHPGRVRTQGFGVTPTRYFSHNTNDVRSNSGSSLSQIVSLREEVNLLRTEMREFMQQFRMQQPPQGSSQMLNVCEEVKSSSQKEKGMTVTVLDDLRIDYEEMERSLKEK
ncbi:hypothetical protein IEQ34_019098 [Dendrobium chrysotoxum]|uniref:Uncharacterized protein n=1 Tax=Dendrobium chrysotoxum TaxID=161865 RepID=A0AAV7FQ96_DENCH|nr:hypothetical protein IEQ34_019098 [Dendrobium chrysotoxum]